MTGRQVRRRDGRQGSRTVEAGRMRRRPLAPGLALLTAGLTLSLAGCIDGRVPFPVGPDSATTALGPETSASLDAALAEGLDLAGATGAIAGVWAPWAGEWLASPGSVGAGIDPATGRPAGGSALTTDMQFRIGTLTASMTCTVLLGLVEDQRVGLDDPVSEHLPRLPGVQGITLRQLCQNTAGLGQASLEPQFVNNPTRHWPPLELVSGGLGSTRAGQPGRVWTRSDAGVQLLGMALEEATGDSWSELYRRYLFEPLGLADTSYPDPRDVDLPGAHPNGWAAALDADGVPDCTRPLDVTRLSNSMSGVAGGAVSTLEDLRTWSRALATGSLLSPELVAQQWTSVREGDAPEWRRYGLGAEQLGPMRGGAGAIPGFLSATLSDPESGLTVVVMVNDSSAGAEFVLALAQRLAAIAAAAPVVDGRPSIRSDVPWTAVEATVRMRAYAACPTGAAEDAAAPVG
ncbi:serine hydrolase [Cryobacterium sp. SO1]|uniref:serine hydrolase domain-containing protein n=1 Tax=Cryobacterium sp. SO1 TaxID=1897061 RepID=UPI001023D5D4|nr:serine hydrolase domain-containing protein [Cryobacterium sp. SO1]